MNRKIILIAVICIGLSVLLGLGAAVLTGFILPKRTVKPETASTGQFPEPEDTGRMQINEVMASNKATLADKAGKFADWVEIYNGSMQNENLEGAQLRCGKDIWNLPDVTLNSGDYLLIFCDGSNQSVDGELHSSFSISKGGGETLRLYGKDGEKLDTFPVTKMSQDFSARREADGSISITAWPTPGFENDEDGYLAFTRSKTARTESLVISEVMVSNDAYAPLSGQYYDWVELYNPTDRVLSLRDFYISDQGKNRQRCRLPKYELSPGEYVLLYCSSDQNGNQVLPMGLNAIKEELFLSDSEGVLLDYVNLKGIPYRFSYGRDDNGSYSYFETPTPGKPNTDGAHFTGEKPVLVGRDGIFNSKDDVIVELSGTGSIRYTVDGSEPNASSYEYIGPMRVETTCVIRAASFQPDHCRSEILSLSYFIDEGHKLPVVSLVCDDTKMFAEEGGMYFNPSLDLEIPASVMFYGEEGQFRMDCGVKLHGATSKYVQEKKSLKLNFRNRYGGELNYDLFGNGVSVFSSLLLRSGQEGRSSSYMRDALMHDAAIECFPALPAQDHRYTVLYINAQYWGVYNLREAHSKEHFANHYGFNANLVTHWHGSWSKNSLAEEVYQYALSHNLSDPSQYEYVTKYVDTDSVIAWLIIQDYCGNFDFNSPNMRFYWTEEDQKLRYALVDLDLGLFTAGNLTSLTYRGYYAYCKLAGALMKNAEFRKEFCEQLNDALTGGMSDEAMLERIDRFADEIRPEIEREKARWGGRTADWEHLVDDIRFFITKKDGQARNMVKLMVSNGGLKSSEAREYLPAFYK